MNKSSENQNLSDYLVVIPVPDIRDWYEDQGYIRGLPMVEKVKLTLHYGKDHRPYDFRYMENQTKVRLGLSPTTDYHEALLEYPDLRYEILSTIRDFKENRSQHLELIEQYLNFGHRTTKGLEKAYSFRSILSPTALVFRGKRCLISPLLQAATLPSSPQGISGI